MNAKDFKDFAKPHPEYSPKNVGGESMSTSISAALRDKDFSPHQEIHFLERFRNRGFGRLAASGTEGSEDFEIIDVPQLEAKISGVREKPEIVPHVGVNLRLYDTARNTLGGGEATLWDLETFFVPSTAFEKVDPIEEDFEGKDDFEEEDDDDDDTGDSKRAKGPHSKHFGSDDSLSDSEV